MPYAQESKITVGFSPERRPCTTESRRQTSSQEAFGPSGGISFELPIIRTPLTSSDSQFHGSFPSPDLTPIFPIDSLFFPGR
jgi:hypothetical protein